MYRIKKTEKRHDRLDRYDKKNDILLKEER